MIETNSSKSYTILNKKGDMESYLESLISGTPAVLQGRWGIKASTVRFRTG